MMTPSNFYHIVCISITSRIIVLLIQLISNNLLEDHQADAYRNIYFKAITNDTTLPITNVYEYFYKSIQGFTKWDSQYLLEIANDGYISEQHLVFLPLYPMTIYAAKQLLFDHKNMDNIENVLFNSDFYSPTEQVISAAKVENYIRSTVVGYALNNFIFFPMASVFLFLLTKLVKKRDDKYAKNVIWWFCFNPASIFFSACYTESLFAALTFGAIFLIEYRAQNYLLVNHQGDFMPLNHFNRLLSIYFPSLAFLALSSATRSNGLLTMGFLGYQFLLKYAPLIKLNRSHWTLMIYVSVILEGLQDLLVVFMSLVLAASGYITFQLYSYMEFCKDEQLIIQKGTLNIRPDWCHDIVPHPYRQVQRKYWSIEAFEYYELKQVPNFLLALPVTYLVLFGSLKKSKEIAITKGEKKQLAYYMQGIMLTLFCAIFVHVQVTTRLICASCPVVYWIMADTAKQSKWSHILLVAYCMSYLIIGTILHTNFYPWT